MTIETKPVRILHIDSSPRGERSHSRQLTRELVQSLQDKHPGATVTYHDLSREGVPFVNETWIAAAFSAPDTHTPELTQALAVSNAYIEELFAADILVFGVPMYNFSVPAVFKAYIDQISRAGLTFSYPGFEGLVTGKKAYVITARGGGGYGAGEAMEAMNYEDPYIRAVFGFIGITDVTFLHANYLNNDEMRTQAYTEIRQNIQELAAAA